MNKILIAFISLFIISCDCESTNDLSNYKCSSEQLKLVEKETEICNNSKGYHSSICFEQAKKSNCDKIKRRRK